MTLSRQYQKLKILQVAELLFTTGSVQKTSELSGLSRKTIVRYQRTPEFKQIFEQLQNKAIESFSRRVVLAQLRAIEVIERLMNSESELVQLKAASVLLSSMQYLENARIEQRITELERLVRNEQAHEGTA